MKYIIKFLRRSQSVCERSRNTPQNGLKRPPGCSENVRKHSEISPNISVFTSFSYFLNMSNEYAYLLAQMAGLVAAQAQNAEWAFQSLMNNIILQWGSERADLLAQISLLQARNVALNQCESERAGLLAQISLLQARNRALKVLHDNNFYLKQSRSVNAKLSAELKRVKALLRIQEENVE